MADSYTILTELFAIFNAVIQWLTGAMGTVLEMFYADNKFTVLGAITLVSLGIGVCFLVVGVIRSFIRFR